MDLQKGFCDQLTLEWFPTEVLIQIFSFLDARFLQETVSQLCSKFYAVISNEAYWKSRIKKKWPSKYPPITPTVELRWDQCAVEREEMLKRFGPEAQNFEGITITKTHYSACDAILLLPIQNQHLMVSGSRDRSLALWDVKGVKGSTGVLGVVSFPEASKVTEITGLSVVGSTASLGIGFTVSSIKSLTESEMMLSL